MSVWREEVREHVVEQVTGKQPSGKRVKMKSRGLCCLSLPPSCRQCHLQGDQGDLCLNIYKGQSSMEHGLQLMASIRF